MSMISDVAVFALGVALLVAGGGALVKGSVSVASRLGVSPLVVGLTMVAFGTSSPELALNMVAAANGHTELSFGNIIGSNIANIGLILGLSALIRPIVVKPSLVRREIPLLIGVSGVLIAISYLKPNPVGADAGLARSDGVLLLVAFVAVFWLMLHKAKQEGATDGLISDEEQEVMEKAKKTPKTLAAGLFLGGLAMLLGGGKLAELGAVGVASNLGMSDELIGLTVVAIATSLPEFATSLAAVRHGHVDLAVGNVVGSNLFNILLVMGATATVAPVELPALAAGSFLVMGLLSVLILPMGIMRGGKISRLEGGALLAIYIGFLSYEVVVAIGAR